MINCQLISSYIAAINIYSSCFFRDFLRKQSFVWVNAAAVPIRPDDSHCIVALLFHANGMDIGLDVLLFDQHCPTQFVNACRALALQS